MRTFGLSTFCSLPSERAPNLGDSPWAVVKGKKDGLNSKESDPEVARDDGSDMRLTTALRPNKDEQRRRLGVARGEVLAHAFAHVYHDRARTLSWRASTKPARRRHPNLSPQCVGDSSISFPTYVRRE